jgi:hypothetical protein
VTIKIKSVLHLMPGNCVEATWVDEVVTISQMPDPDWTAPLIADPENEGQMIPDPAATAPLVDQENITETAVRCHYYDQYQMDMLRADLGAGAPTYADLIADVLAAIPVPTPEESAAILANAKTAKNAEINAARLAANFGSFEYSGKSFATDQLSRSDIDGINGYVSLYAALPAGWPGAWKAMDNSYLSIADVSAWKLFYSAMVGAGNANFAKAQGLKATLAAATTLEQVAAVQW